MLTRVLVLCLILVLSLPALACEDLNVSVSSDDSSLTTLPSVATIIREADRQGTDEFDLLDRYYARQQEEIKDHYQPLIDRARENQVRRYEIQRDADLELLDENYRQRVNQVSDRLDRTTP